MRKYGKDLRFARYFRRKCKRRFEESSIYILSLIHISAIAIYQQPGSNSLDVSKGVKAKMEELATSFPTGVAYNVTLDTTDVIHASIDEVMVTFFETTLLVVLVIFLFLQNWRAVIIPCITIPVSLIGTLAVMAAFGFSINTLTLFGLILAVAIVVADAIVVVENASRLLETGPVSYTHLDVYKRQPIE